MFGAGLLDHGAAAGKLMTGSSPIGVMVCRVMERACIDLKLQGVAGVVAAGADCGEDGIADCACQRTAGQVATGFPMADPALRAVR